MTEGARLARFGDVQLFGYPVYLDMTDASPFADADALAKAFAEVFQRYYKKLEERDRELGRREADDMFPRT